MTDNFLDSVNTVLGRKRLSELGKTLTHEHLIIDIRQFCVPAPKHIKCFPEKWSLQDVGYIRQYPFSSAYNLNFYDDDAKNAVCNELELFKEAGGRTIVENTNHGLKRDISFMKKVSQLTGVNVIAPTGYYTGKMQDASTQNMTKEEMYNLMCKELEEGCVECPDVKAGFIGEIGCNWPIGDFEKRSISASGEVQAQLRCSVSFHSEGSASAPMEILRVYQEAGGDATRAIMSHIDLTLMKKEDLMEFADATKCYIQFDLFGIECFSALQLFPSVYMLSDWQRIKRIALLKEEKKLDRVLMSHDLSTKHRLMHFGGHGYSYIYNNIIPIMINEGFTTEEMELITVENPRRWLTQ